MYRNLQFLMCRSNSFGLQVLRRLLNNHQGFPYIWKSHARPPAHAPACLYCSLSLDIVFSDDRRCSVGRCVLVVLRRSETIDGYIDISFGRFYCSGVQDFREPLGASGASLPEGRFFLCIHRRSNWGRLRRRPRRFGVSLGSPAKTHENGPRIDFERPPV